jgi:hypothetical protein
LSASAPWLGTVRSDDDKYRFIDQPGGCTGGTVKV